MTSLIHHHLGRGKSVLLLGPRQTGKTTLIEGIPADLSLTFSLPSLRQRYEKNPELLRGEVEALKADHPRKNLLVVLDEVQKVPVLLDVVQYLIDKRVARFILTGSSARKLKRGSDTNLLPGRVVGLAMHPLLNAEYPNLSLDNLMSYGSLPGIVLQKNAADREVDLRSYVETYLEEEIRAESLVRRLGHFARFLELAALESGRIVNFSSISQDIGVSHTTIAAFYEILEDTLIALRVDPITKSTTRKKLTRASRYLFFDMGVRRLCAGESLPQDPRRKGELFEHCVGLELCYLAQYQRHAPKIRFWRDPDGPEVDWIIDQGGRYTPVEVKFTDRPDKKDAKNLEVFLTEYRQNFGYIVCTVPRKVRISKSVTAIPWQDVAATLFGL